MAHIHLPDGAFSLQWIAIWWVLAIIILGICLFWLTRIKKIDNRKITLAAMCTAASFAIFQVNVPLFGGVHMNLTSLTGILVGPALGAIIVMIVNILSAAIGHGGWGLVGANFLVNLAETSVAYGTYVVLGRLNVSTFYRAATGTLLGLFIGNVVMIAIILASGIQGVDQTFMEMLYGLSLIAAVNMGMALIESIITGYIVSYIHRVRPDILQEAPAVAAAQKQ